MKKIINVIKNWWYPWGYQVKLNINSWEFTPSEDVTAYELYRCVNNKPISFGHHTIAEYQLRVNKWYDELPDNCKRHLKPCVYEAIEMRQYGE